MTTKDQPQQVGSMASQVIAYAARFLGVPYVWGGMTPSGFDCSGLIQYVFKHFNISLPRTSQEQATVGMRVSAGQQLVPGDLLFYDEPGEGPDSHVALYVGGNQEIVAPHTGLPVEYQTVGNYSHAQRILGVLPNTGSQAQPTPAGNAANPALFGIPGSNGLLGDLGLSPTDWFNGLASALGASDIKDLGERFALIIFGGAILVIGLIILGFSFFTKGGSKKSVAPSQTQSPKADVSEPTMGTTSSTNGIIPVS
jgi:hypothetical protein